jgi:hypothetical protein
MVSAPPPASSVRPRGDVSLCAIGPPQPPRGGPEHLRLLVKHDEYSFCVIEGIENPKIQLAGVVAGTLHEYVKACP